jgi:hypothetical protein
LLFHGKFRVQCRPNFRHLCLRAGSQPRLKRATRPMLAGAANGRERLSPILLPCSPEMCPRVSVQIHEKRREFVLKQRARPPRVPQKSKTRKSVAKPRFFQDAVTIRGASFLVFGWLGDASRDYRWRWDQRLSSRWLRVWRRSIVLRGKDVKKNSASNHKIFGASCSARLHVVVPVQATTMTFSP